MNRFFTILVIAVFTFGIAATAPASDESSLEKKVDAIAVDALSDGRVAGLSVMVGKNGKHLLAKGYGLANIDDETAASSKTVFRIGSITKTFTAVAAMQLVEQGKIQLDAEVQEYLPDYPKHDSPITVHQLLTHTSGIPNYTELNDDWKQDRTHEEMLDVFQNEPLNIEPGNGFNYTNSGYYLLGLIIENVSGMAYSDYLETHIFEPGGLDSTAYINDSQTVPNRALGYSYSDGELVSAKPISMTVPYAAGALESTILDLFKWQQGLANNEFVTSKSFETMTSPRPLADGSYVSYGYGFMVGALDGHRKIAHEGGIDGFVAQFAWYPDDDLTVIVLTNSEGANAPKIERRIARAALGLPEPQIQNLPIDADTAKAYAGTYRSGSTTVRITERDGRIRLTVDEFLTWPVELRYQGDGLFMLAVDPDIRVRFEPGPNGPSKVLLTFGDVIVEAPRIE